MKPKSFALTLAAAVVLATSGAAFLLSADNTPLVGILNHPDQNGQSAGSQAGTATADGKSGERTAANAPGRGDMLADNQVPAWQSSPFSNGAPAATTSAAGNAAPEPEVVPPAEAARRKKMKELGYMIPTEYYKKDVRSLRELARNGDPYAMVHLGEKYYFELSGAKQHPEFDPSMDYTQAARESFTGALAAGNIRSAAIISETYIQENNAVEAYAWHLLSEQLGDSISAEWFKRTKLYAGISEQEKQQARAKLPELIANVNQLSEKMKVKSPFGNQG